MSDKTQEKDYYHFQEKISNYLLNSFNTANLSFLYNNSLKTILDNLGEALLIADSDLQILWQNKNAEVIWNSIIENNPEYSPALKTYFNKSKFNSINDSINEVLTGKPVVLELDVKKKDRTTGWLELRFLPVVENDTVRKIFIIILDVTDKHQKVNSIQQHDTILESVCFAAERFLKSNNLENNLFEVFNKLGNAAKVHRICFYMCLDDNAEIALTKKIFEWKDERKSIKGNFNLIELKIERWQSLLKKGTLVFGPLKYFPDEERKKFINSGIKSILLIPIIIDSDFWGFLEFDDCVKDRDWTITEIDALKAAVQILTAHIQKVNSENELIKAKEEAEKSNLLKAQFLAQMSHEIRTPLNVVLSLSSLIKEEMEPSVSNDLRPCFQMIDSGGRRLIRTIDMILNMAQLQTGGFDYQPKIVDLANGFIDSIFSEFKNLAKEKNITFNFYKKLQKAEVYVDTYTTIQILVNLVDNAVKFTKKGKVDITLYPNEHNCYCLSIKDTGVGISDEYLPDLFTPFTQEEMGYSRTYEGIGLGLALVKKFAELNDILISVETRKNIGSSFTLTFNKHIKNET